MNRNFFRILLAMLFFSSVSDVSLLFAGTYRWTDTDGSIHFSDTPPSSGKQPILQRDDTTVTPSIPSKRSPRTASTGNRQQSNLASKHEVNCAKSSELVNSYTPVDLYLGVAACIKTDNYKDGTFLFALAGVYGRFDRFRVSDKSAHGILDVLLLRIIGSLDPAKGDILLTKIGSSAKYVSSAMVIFQFERCLRQVNLPPLAPS